MLPYLPLVTQAYGFLIPSNKPTGLGQFGSQGSGLGILLIHLVYIVAIADYSLNSHDQLTVISHQSSVCSVISHQSSVISLFSYQSSVISLFRTMRPNQIAGIIYQKLPDLPLENNYQRQDNGQIDPENTLITRLLRYHQYVKKRPTKFRLDWQLTLADYLGINEKIQPERYPGYRQLRENPLPGDQKAIDSLTRQQRQQLINLLTELH
jgi:hypothetical protein